MSLESEVQEVQSESEPPDEPELDELTQVKKSRLQLPKAAESESQAGSMPDEPNVTCRVAKLASTGVDWMQANPVDPKIFMKPIQPLRQRLDAAAAALPDRRLRKSGSWTDELKKDYPEQLQKEIEKTISFEQTPMMVCSVPLRQLKDAQMSILKEIKVQQKKEESEVRRLKRKYPSNASTVASPLLDESETDDLPAIQQDSPVEAAAGSADAAFQDNPSSSPPAFVDTHDDGGDPATFALTVDDGVPDGAMPGSRYGR